MLCKTDRKKLLGLSVVSVLTKLGMHVSKISISFRDNQIVSVSMHSVPVPTVSVNTVFRYLNP